MGEKIVYFFRIEIKGLSGSLLPKEAKGAFLNCISAGKNQEDAKERMLNALAQDKYKLIKIDRVHLFDDLIFNPAVEEEKEFVKMAMKVKKTGEVFYGRFCYWE